LDEQTSVGGQSGKAGGFTGGGIGT